MLTVQGLTKEFTIHRGRGGRRKLVAVDNVSFSIRPGTTVALVGESGSGKSTLGRCVVGLLPPTRGTIRLGNVDLSRRENRRKYRRRLQMVFQDPDESLNRRMAIRSILAEPLRNWHGLRSQALERRIVELLEQVGLSPAMADRFPSQLSGGQQQRVGIARALAAEPEVMILDEPTSALDVSVRAQVLNLLKDLQNETGMAYLLISHDLSMVRYMASEVIVLYLGRVVEHGPTEAIFNEPRHPYTQALLAAVPRLVEPAPMTLTLKGEVGNALADRSGCLLAPRCPMVLDSCKARVQELVPIASGHHVACEVVTGRQSQPAPAGGG